MSDPTITLSSTGLESSPGFKEDRRDYVAELVTLAKELSDHLSESPAEMESIASVLQNLLQILECIDPSILSSEDVEEAVHPSISIVVMLLELGQQDEQFSPLSMMVWKTYPRFIKRFHHIVDSSTINRFYEILLPNCEDGLGMLMAVLTDPDTADRPSLVDDCKEAVQLLKFFIQKLSITLVYCRRHIDSEFFMHGFRLLFVFLGLLHQYPSAFDNMQSLRGNCLQSINKISTTSTITKLHNATVSQLDAESQIVGVEFDKLDLEGIQKVAEVAITANASFISKSSTFLWWGMSTYIADIIELLSTSILSYASDIALRVAITLLHTFCKCQASICVLQPVRNEHQTFQVSITKMISSLRLIIQVSDFLLYVWDFLLIQVCGPLPLSSSIIDPNASIANIARVILLGIYVSMTGKSQSILFDRATAMISETLHFSDLCTARNELLQQQCLTQLISHSENTVRNKVLHTIQSYLEGKEKVRSDVKLLELCAKSLPMKELLHPSDADSQQSTLQLLRLCVQYSMQASEMGVNDFDRFAVSLLVIRALLAFQSNQESKSPDVESILNNFTSKPVVGTVLLRYIQSLSKQSDYYLHLKANSTEISVSQADKLTHLFETISILLDCLIAHRIPNQVRSVMAKNMCLVAKCASTLHTAYKTKSKKQANLDYFLVAILSALRILDSFISVYVQSEVTDDVFHAEVVELVAHLCRLLSYDKEDGQRCSILWQVQHKTIVLLSRMIRLNPKRAGLIAKMMGSTTIIALVKSFHMGKLAAQLETGNKLDPDEEQVMNIVSAACKSDVNEELSISTTFLDVYTEKMTSQKKHERDADLFEPLQANKRGKTTS